MKLCTWCRKPIPPDKLHKHPESEYCKKSCRQTAWRLRRRRATDQHALEPKRCAYADPPYPRLADYYADEETFAGEVDHHRLIARLVTGYDGWALSTSRDALRYILPLCPRESFVAPWVKPHGVSGKTLGAHNAWEPVIVRPARRLPPGMPDWISTPPARYRTGAEAPLIGRKPLKFIAWMFDLLGLLPGDHLDDLYPGTGIVGRAWSLLSRDASHDVGSDASRRSPGDVSPVDEGDRSPLQRGDRSPLESGDLSPAADRDGSIPAGGVDVSPEDPRTHPGRDASTGAGVDARRNVAPSSRRRLAEIELGES